MNELNSINLLSSGAKLPDRISGIADNLRGSSVMSLTIFLIVSVVIGGLYLFMRIRFTTLVARRDQLLSQISALAQTEGLLVALRERGHVAGKLLTSQVNWAAAVDRMNQVAPPPTLASVAVDGKHNVVMTVRTNTLEETFPVLSAIVADVEAKRILSPHIVSFLLDKDGISHLVVSFFPVL